MFSVVKPLPSGRVTLTRMPPVGSYAAKDMWRRIPGAVPSSDIALWFNLRFFAFLCGQWQFVGEKGL